MANNGYTNPTWDQQGYSIQPQLQLEEYDLVSGSQSQNVSQQQRRMQNSSMFTNASYPSTQNSWLTPTSGTTTASSLAAGMQTAPSRSVTYNGNGINNIPLGTTNGHRSSSYGSTTTNNLFNANNNNNQQQQTASTSNFNTGLGGYVNHQPYADNVSQTSFPFGGHQFQQQSQSAPAITATSIAESGLGLSPPLVSSPDAIHTSFQGIHNRTQPQASTSAGGYDSAKRQRVGDEEEGGEEAQPADGGAAKNKGPGACLRCKNLKVKCEFKSDTDPCKRCLNGGHDCVIPGRKKRRTPPKREHLLNQIREQASQIQNLMAQLDVATKRSSLPSENGQTLSPNHTSDLMLDDSDDSDSKPRPDVEDWLAKARESMRAFDDYIGSMPSHMLIKEEFEDTASNGSGDYGEYEIAIEDEDGSIPFDEMEESNGGSGLSRRTSSKDGSRRSRSNDRGSMSSQGTAATQRKDQISTVVPSEAVPFGLIATLATKKQRSHSADNSEEENDENNVGVANAEYFGRSPGPETSRKLPSANTQPQAPHILTRGIITPKEAEMLFNIYFEKMNLSVSLLDPVLYTAQKTCWRSPFLFTVICAIASRHYSERPELYQQAMHYAQLAAGTALISGHKSVELVSGYILLSLYPVPARRWEDDRSWLYLGLAIRIATDLNLHHPNTAKPINEQHARELLNRTRVWLNCFNLDRSTGSQYGKSPIIKNTDYIANHSEGWWESSEYNIPHFDIHLCAYNAELRVMANFLARIYNDPKHPTGLNKEADFELIATETDDELLRVGDKWFKLLAKTDMTVPMNCFRAGLLKLAYSYARLIALSFGFQHAFGKNNTDENPFLLRCLSAASDVVKAVVNDIGRPTQRVYLRHGPEAQSVFLTFASAFLVKLLQPKFASYLTVEQRLEIRGLVQQVVDLLGCKEVAIDDRHGPKLYSRFLKGLLATPMAKVDVQSPVRSNSNLPLRRKAIARNASASSSPTPTPDYERPIDFGTGSGDSFDVPSPTSSSSLSPLMPNQAALSFDQFAPMSSGVDPFFAGHAPTDSEATQALNMPDFFQPPLPYDAELLQSMQSLSQGWGDMPGFSWMSQLSQNNDVNMNSNQY